MSNNCNRDCANCKFAAIRQETSREILISFRGSSERVEKDYHQYAGEDETACSGGVLIRPAKEGEDPGVIVDVIDCNRLEESLLDTTYLLDEGRRIVLAFDNYDQYLATEHSIDFKTMSLLLGAPAVTGEGGIPRLLSAIVTIHSDRLWLPKSIQGRHTDEDDHARLGFVTGALQETVRHSKDNSKHTIAQKIDHLLTNRLLGLPLLCLVLFAVFEATFALGAYPQQWIESGVDSLAGALAGSLPEGWLSSMLADGVVRGVGAVLAFLPNIMILFFFLSMLEDSGYMARAAYVMDKIMHYVGLHGNSFIPMLIGFGCNVPAIMAARNIQNRKDRTLTMLMIPFMSCSARLPVYMLFVSAFFARYKALVMMGIYLAGIVIAIIFAFVMKRTKYFRKGTEDYVSELPPFHAPHFRQTWGHIWERVKDYLQKISSVILISSVIIWALEFFPADRTDRGKNKEESCLAMIGKAAEPVMKPLGFDWKMNVCLLTGLPAKEAIVSTMGILYHSEDEESLAGTMRTEGVFNTANSLSFLVFVLLYFPCIATLATLGREAGRKWAVFTIINSLLLAWLLSFATFQLVTLII